KLVTGVQTCALPIFTPLPDDATVRTVTCSHCGGKLTVQPRSAAGTTSPSGASGGASPKRSLPAGCPTHVGRFQIQARLGAGAFRTEERRVGKEGMAR